MRTTLLGRSTTSMSPAESGGSQGNPSAAETSRGSTKCSDWSSLAIRVLLGLSAFFIIVLSTRWGPALGDDSYAYIKPARDALAGQPMQFNPSFPPLLPMVLAAVGHLGVEPLVGIRFLNAALFATTVLLAYELLAKVGNRPRAIAFLGAASILLSARLIELFASAMSEPLYLTLALGGVLAAVRYFDRPWPAWLVASGLLVGLAALTRYAGVACILAVASALLIRSHRSTEKRAAEVFVFAAMSCTPLGAYVARNVLTLGRPVGQGHWSWALVREFPWRSLVRNSVDWLLPGKFVAGLEDEIVLVAAVTVAATMAGYMILYREPLAGILARQLRQDAHLVLILYGTSTLIMLAFSRGLFSGGTASTDATSAPCR